MCLIFCHVLVINLIISSELVTNQKTSLFADFQLERTLFELFLAGIFMEYCVQYTRM